MEQARHGRIVHVLQLGSTIRYLGTCRTRDRDIGRNDNVAVIIPGEIISLGSIDPGRVGIQFYITRSKGLLKQGGGVYYGRIASGIDGLYVADHDILIENKSGESGGGDGIDPRRIADIVEGHAHGDGGPGGILSTIR